VYDDEVSTADFAKVSVYYFSFTCLTLKSYGEELTELARGFSMDSRLSLYLGGRSVAFYVFAIAFGVRL
jgi:hypothetical protein